MLTLTSCQGLRPGQSLSHPVCLGVRPRSRPCVRFAAAPAQEAGLVVFQNHRQHATLALTVGTDGARQVVLTAVEAGTTTRLGAVAVTDAEVVLAVGSDESGYTFRAGNSTVGGIERPFFSTERAGGFVGVHIGLYGVGDAEAGDAGEVLVRWFEYGPRPAVGTGTDQL
ncbi:hypothetical protein ABTZ93_12125 [Streptomyces sp. NPDC097941]|uniref:beta-xylosidase family glycoside hydrolase n=1 Tax=Streptomyces sp. NPDC097941 TaxID=3155685 RepID=UPI003322AEE3